MPNLIDTLKSWVFVQETPVAVETKAAVPTLVSALNIAPTFAYQVLNQGLGGYGQPQPQLNPVFLSILGRIQAAARSVEWKVKWVKQDGTEQDAPAAPLARLLASPNPDQTWTQFINQYLTQLLQHGNVFIYCGRVPGPSLNAGQAQELRVMPAATEILGGQDWRTPVAGYRTPRLTGGYETFTPDQVLHVKKWQLSDTSPYGLSPVAAATYQLRNLDLAMRQRIEQMANGGPNVVMFTKESPTTESLTQQQGAELVRKVTGPQKVTYVEGEFDTKVIGLSPVDLDILNSVKLDAGMVADVLQFPHILLSTSDGNTYANVDAATKALYSDCVLPLLWELEDGLNHKLAPAQGNRYVVSLDYSGIESLKPNLAPVLTALAAADYLPVNAKNRILGLPDVPGGDHTYILARGAVIVDSLDPTALSIDPANAVVKDPAAGTDPATGKPLQAKPTTPDTAASSENGPANAA